MLNQDNADMLTQQYREVLLENATLLIGMKGYKAMNIRELLSLSRITRRRFDELYDSKCDLLKDLLRQYAANHLRVLNEILSSQQTEDDRVLAYF